VIGGSNQLLSGEVLVAERCQVADVTQADAMVHHSDQLIDRLDAVSQPMQLFYIFESNAMRPHPNKLIESRLLETLHSQLINQAQVNLVYSHHELLLGGGGTIAALRQLRSKACFRSEYEMARSLSVFKPAFAVQRAGVAHQLEPNLTTAGGHYLRGR
jgi:hypothetical protein